MGLLTLLFPYGQAIYPSYTFQLLIGPAGSSDLRSSGLSLEIGHLGMGLADAIDTASVIDNDVTAYLEAGTLRMTESDGGRTSRLDFELRSPSFDPIAWQEVFFIVDPGEATETTYFGGYVLDANPRRQDGALIWTVRCEGYMARVQRTPLVRKAYVNQTVGAIVADLFTTAGLTDFDTTTNVSAGPTLTIFSTNGETLAATMNRLALVATDKAAAAWTWRIDGNRSVWMAAASDQPAPFSLVDSQDADWGNSYPPEAGSVVRKTDTTDIRNRVTVRGGVIASQVQTQTFTGDGATTSFQLSRRPIRDIVQITVSGNRQSYGTAWYNSHGGAYNCLVNYSAGVIVFPEALPPAASAPIVVQYRYDESLAVQVEEASSYAEFGFWFDFEVEDKSISTEDDATDLALAILDAYAFGVTTGSFGIRRGGLFSGQQIDLNFSDVDLVGRYVIRSVTYEIASNGHQLRCSVQIGDRWQKFSEAFGGSQAFIRSAYSQTTVPRIEGEVGTIRIRDAALGGNATSYSSGDGWFAGLDNGAWKFRVGEATGGRLAWNGSYLQVGGFTVGSTYLASGNFKLDAANGRMYFSPTVYFEWDSSTNMVYLNGMLGGLYGYFSSLLTAATDLQVGIAGLGDIYLLGSGTSYFTEKLWLKNEVEIDGALNHDGGQAGFFGVAPTTRPSAYTFSNGNTDKGIDCDATTLDELADVVYTMWTDLKNLGLLQ